MIKQVEVRTLDLDEPGNLPETNAVRIHQQIALARNRMRMRLHRATMRFELLQAA